MKLRWRLSSIVLIVLMVVASIWDSASAQYQLKKLNPPSDIRPGDQFGYAVSLSGGQSGDPQTFIVGSPQYKGGRGAAWVYTKNQKPGDPPYLLEPNDDDAPANFGSSVALSDDGNTAIIGGPADDGGIGAVWQFNFVSGEGSSDAGHWQQFGQKLVLSTAHLQGASISFDGRTAVGARDQAWIWLYGCVPSHHPPCWWSADTLTHTGDLGDSSFGLAVGISGETYIVGGPTDNNGVGAVWIYAIPPGPSETKLIGSGAAGASLQGKAIALSLDGSTAIVGGPNDNSNGNGQNGAVWFFARAADGTWGQQGSKMYDDNIGVSANQGSSVALTADGNIALVGAPNYSTKPGGPTIGAVSVYTRANNIWSRQMTVFPNAPESTLRFGLSLAVSADGTAIVGGNDDTNAGAVWILTPQNKIGSEKQ